MTQRHPEHQLQRACVQYLRLLPPPPTGPWWTAIAPLPGTSARQGAQAKALGLRPGVPDLILLHHGTFIGVELKAATGRLSKAQAQMRDVIHLVGGDYIIVRSLDELIDDLKQMGVAPLGGDGRRALEARPAVPVPAKRRGRAQRPPPAR